jgi:integrase
LVHEVLAGIEPNGRGHDWLAEVVQPDMFEDLTIEAGLPPIRLHDLRHGAASLMLAAGVDMKVVQETLGHSNVALTANTYTSIYPDLATAAAEATAAIVPRARRDA